MRKLTAALIMFMAFSTFAGNHDSLVGDWNFNVKKFKESPEYKEAAKDPQGGPMMEMVLTMFAKMSFTFTKTDAIATVPGMDGKTKKEKGTYTVLADSGDTLEINAKGADGKEQIMIITFIDAKNIKMEPKTKQPGPVGAMYLIKK
ncbi:MAG: hypothetical protein NE328_01210 [Lentisphaeraceae bacterium]|nr:hypothetical protein [Lentisphaeraceae bacterium]